MVTQNEYSVREASQAIGLPPSTIRFYCNKGLVPGVRHRAAGRRVFTEAQVDWLRNLVSLRAAGMSIPELKRYTGLCRKGNSTIPERKAMLETKKRQLWHNLEDIHSSIDFIERRAEIFNRITSGELPEPEEWI